MATLRGHPVRRDQLRVAPAGFASEYGRVQPERKTLNYDNEYDPPIVSMIMEGHLAADG